ncbi:ATP-binding protein [Streptomyces sp. NPDC001792]|uniref:ATP-binding protein n=1 Tax=Streptomyces sp. NPDC001792 TaxID=3154524 RepID=UPI00332D67F8
MRVLYGREEPLRVLIDPATPVVVVTGDEGAGKSTLLSACRNTAQESSLASVDITRLPHRTGGLQVAIFNQLIAITDLLVRDQTVADRFAHKVATRARTAVGPRRKEFALAVAKELLTLVKERVGSDLGQALGEFFASSATDGSEAIREKLHNQVDADALRALVDIADEVASLGEASTLYLLFENAQNLSDEDLRQLADLASVLPASVVLRLEHQDASDEHRRRIRLLTSAGITEVSLSGLSEETVRFWCRARNVPESLHKRIYQSTHGYPLFVDDAIDQVNANRRLGNISPTENFRASTVESLNELDPESAAAARRLSAFLDPPQDERVVDILGEGMTLTRWEGVRSRLERARIFTTSANGVPWFHEVRRRCIWESLSPALRNEVADRAVSFIVDSYREARDPELLINLALVAPASTEVRNDPRALHMAGATLDEVALLSSLLEIAEGQNGSAQPEIPTALGDAVFDYCRLAFMPDVDALPALESLGAAEVVFVANNDQASALIPRLSELAYMLTLGRAGAELPRFPVPTIASVLFRTAISRYLHDFVTCSYGIGYPSLRKLVEDGAAAYRAQTQRHVVGRSVHGVLLRASIEQQPFYAYSTFHDAEKAARSAVDLQRAAGRHLGLTVDIDWLSQFPTGMIRGRRFVNALERIAFTPRSDLTFMDVVSQKADLLRYVRASCSRIEKAVLDLEKATSYFVLEKGRDAMVVEVAGGSDGVRKLESVVPDDYSFSGPYKWANLRKMLNLGIGESVESISFTSSGATFHDPKRILDSLSKKAQQYNRNQPRPWVDASAHALQNALSVSMRDTYHDAQALCAVLSQYGDVRLKPRKTLLAVYAPGEEGERLGWRHAMAVYTRIPTPDINYDTVKVKVIECDDTDLRSQDFDAHFAEDLAAVPRASDGHSALGRPGGMANANFLLCRELGYEAGSVSFFR